MTRSIPPWYRQFWPLFLIALPLCAVIASFVTLYIAASGNTDMVVDDYYKEGKAINQRLEKYERAKQLNISLALGFPAADRVKVSFLSGKPKQPQPMAISFYHPTLGERDFTVQLIADANGVYTGQLPQEIRGKWQVLVHPFDKEWKIRDVIALPREQDVVLAP